MLKSSLRSRYRYVRFEVIGENAGDVPREEIEKLVYQQILRLVGSLGASQMDVKVMSKNNVYFVRVKRGFVDTMRGILPLIDSLGKYNARPRIVRTSGTIKKTVGK